MNRLSKTWLVAVLATISLAANAQSQSSGSEQLGAVQVVEPQSASNTQQVLIQSLPSQQVQVKQPTTVVEAAPLGDSRADQMRRMRQDVEVQTEQKIVEKLEQSRLEDERRRMDKLFGNVNLGAEAQSQPQPQPQPQPQVVPVIFQAPAPEEKAKSPDDDKVRHEELLGAIRESKAPIEPIKEEAKSSRTYFSGLLGAASYPGVSNLQGQLALGAALGTQLENNVSLEGQFIYSSYYLNDKDAIFQVPGFQQSLYRKLDQYNFGLNAKIGFLSGAIQPYVGGGASYTYRNYKDLAVITSSAFGSSVSKTSSVKAVSSHALDLAAMGGVNFQVAKNLALGIEYRYSFNLIHWADSDFDNVVNQYLSSGRNLVEDTSYQTFGVNATYQF